HPASSPLSLHELFRSRVRLRTPAEVGRRRRGLPVEHRPGVGRRPCPPRCPVTEPRSEVPQEPDHPRPPSLEFVETGILPPAGVRSEEHTSELQSPTTL